MQKADLYNFDGKKKESVSLPKKFDVKPNPHLLSQAVHVYEDRAHLGLARAKTRSEVRISTKKIYKQKGTGGARHGAKSAPIFVGGGVTHGPKGIKRVLHLSKSHKDKALLYAFNYKFKDSGVVLVDNIGKLKKTKDASTFINKVLEEKNWKIKNNILVVFSEKNIGVLRVFRNLTNVVCESYKDLNAFKIFLANGLIIDKDALVENGESKKEGKNEIKVKKSRFLEDESTTDRKDIKKAVKKTKSVSAKSTVGKRNKLL